MTSEKTKQRQETFLKAFAECATISGAARAAGVHRSCHYDWLSNEHYEAKFADAKEEVIDTMSYECFRRAVLGVEEPIFFQGCRVGKRGRIKLPDCRTIGGDNCAERRISFTTTF